MDEAIATYFLALITPEVDAAVVVITFENDTLASLDRLTHYRYS